MHRNWLAFGALLASLCVALGAFGAHALAERVTPDALVTWRTAAQYHQIHAVAIVVSEETGQVSICHSGLIERNLPLDKFRRRLSQLLLHDKYERDHPQQLESESRVPDHGVRPLVSHQAKRGPGKRKV